jgi:hypothetical protein
MDNGAPPRASKKDVALAILDKGNLLIHLDPRRTGVVVPPRFRGQPRLILQVGRGMAVPIPDLVVDNGGISATLSFDRTPFWCSMPWSSVFALLGADARGMVWDEDVPPDHAEGPETRETRPDDAPRGVAGTQPLKCSFCGKTQQEVRKLIAGPTVYICDECVFLCVEILNEGSPDAE